MLTLSLIINEGNNEKNNTMTGSVLSDQFALLQVFLQRLYALFRRLQK